MYASNWKKATRSVKQSKSNFINVMRDKFAIDEEN